MPVIVLMSMMLVLIVMVMTMVMMITLAFKPGKRCQNAPAVRDRLVRGAAGRRAPRVRHTCCVKAFGPCFKRQLQTEERRARSCKLRNVAWVNGLRVIQHTHCGDDARDSTDVHDAGADSDARYDDDHDDDDHVSF